MSIHILNNKHGVSAQNFLNRTCSDFESRKQRRHEVWILSCCLELELVESFVADLKKAIRVTDVYLAFSLAEICKIGPTDTQQKLQQIKTNLKDLGINFEWTALKAHGLVNCNGYAVIQRSDTAITEGIVITTSVNFTAVGFTGCNVELAYSSTTKKDLKDFVKIYHYLCEKLGCNIEAVMLQEGTCQHERN